MIATISAGLSAFGIIHSASVGWLTGDTALVAIGYLLVAAVFVIKYLTDGENRGPVDLPESELHS